MRHIISTDDYLDYKIITRMASARTIHNKQKYLNIIVSPIRNELEYEIMINGKIILITQSFKDAIRTYNLY